MAKQGLQFEIDAAAMANFQAALREYAKVTSQDTAGILNRAAKNVSARAISFTPKARLSRFPFNADPNRVGTTRSQRPRYFYAKGARKGRKGTPLAEAEKLWRSKRASSGYIKAGFLNALIDFGGTTKNRPFRRGDAARGWGRKATNRKAEAVLANYADGSDKVAFSPLNKAVNFVAIDMASYAAMKLGRTAKKYSAKQIKKMVGA